MSESETPTKSQHGIRDLKALSSKFWVITFFSLFISVGVVSSYANYLLERTIQFEHPVEFVVEKGANLNSVINRLIYEHKISAPKILIKIYSILTRKQGGIRAGEYQLKKGQSIKSIISMLRRGETLLRSITFPEGLTSQQWLVILNANPFLTHSLKHKTIQDVGTLLSLTQGGIEGRFFPDTYLFNRGVSDISILHSAHKKMISTIQTAWQDRDNTTAVQTSEEALILASIVEKETAYEPDRSYIASVFNNRLVLNMKLQSDPTAIYDIKNFDGDIKRSHLKRKSPYNTYVISGLPKGPICNPGLASIMAVINPPPSDYLYFVARGDGTSEFSKSLSEHNRAVRRYQKSTRSKNYRSTPLKNNGT